MSFIKKLVLSIFVAFVSLATLVEANTQDWSTLRKEKSANIPSVIYNNDGNDDAIGWMKFRHISDRAELLKPRMNGLENVDIAVFYGTGTSHLFTHRTKIGEAFGGDRGWREWVTEAHAQGWDPLEAVIAWSKENGKPVFFTHRMNDLHEASGNEEYAAHYRSRWAKENRQFLIRPDVSTPASGWINDPSWFWAAMDYSNPEVRDYVFSLIEEVIDNYDVDGIELDFMRFPIFFRSQADGKPVTEEERVGMSDLIAKIRNKLDVVGKERGQPLLLAVHIPDSLDYAHEAGLDVRNWLQNGLIDIVVGGGDFQLRPWRELVAECKPYAVPVYASFNQTLLGNQPEVWYAEAYDALNDGVQGVATFNYFTPQSPIFRNIGSLERLSTLPKAESHELNRQGTMQMRGMGSFVRGGEKYLSDEVGKRWIKRPDFSWPDSKWENNQ